MRPGILLVLPQRFKGTLACAIFTCAVAGLLAPSQAMAQLAPAAKADSATRDYTTEAGDTLQRIARRLFKYGGSWQELRDLNGIARANENLVRPGQVLRMKQAWLSPPTLPLPQSQARISSASAGMTVQTGNVSAPAQLQQSVGEDARVRTAQAGGSLTLEDGSVALLAPNTELELVQVRKDALSGQVRSILRLVTGSVEVVVTKLKGARPDRMSVITRTSTLGVRGTTFRVHSPQGALATTSEVLEGEVEFSASGAAVALPGGFGSKAEANSPPLTPVALLPASSGFLRWPEYEMGMTAPTTARRFEWSAVSAAGYYEIMVAADSRFESPIFVQRTQTPAASFDALPRKFLFVRVRAYDANGLGGYDLTRGLPL